MKMIETVLAFSFTFLSFLVMYGVLNKIKLFERSVNFVISLIVSLFILLSLYSYTHLVVTLFSFLILLIFSVFLLLTFYFYRKR